MRVQLLISLELSLRLHRLLHVGLEMQEVIIYIILNLSRLRQMCGVVSVSRNHVLRIEIEAIF